MDNIFTVVDQLLASAPKPLGLFPTEEARAARAEWEASILAAKPDFLAMCEKLATAGPYWSSYFEYVSMTHADEDEALNALAIMEERHGAGRQLLGDVVSIFYETDAPPSNVLRMMVAIVKELRTDSRERLPADIAALVSPAAKA